MIPGDKIYISRTSSAYPKKKQKDVKKSPVEDGQGWLSALGLGLALPKIWEAGSGFWIQIECSGRGDFKHCGAALMMTLQNIGASLNNSYGPRDA